MARSIHATLRNPRDQGEIERKRLIKELVATERQRRREPPPITPSEAVPIVVDEPGGHARYPASIEDLRAIVERLPPGSLSGLRRIELSLGGHVEGAHEIVPGVFSGRVLGRYSPTGPDIHLYAYVYDASPADRAILSPYLRMEMLSTFVHEVGHHLDFSTRVARGRWRADDEEEREIHAEAIQHAWTHDHVIPYLEEQYPEEVAALQRWIEEHGGISLPLSMLAGDPRTTGGADGARLFFTVEGAFESLFEGVGKGQQPPRSQVDFARGLHHGEHDEEALAILARVLRDFPGDMEASTLRADIFVHQGRFDEAAAIAGSVLATNADDADAWQVLRDVAAGRGEWALVIEITSRLGALCVGESAWRRLSNLRWRARARIELGHWEDAERDLEELSAARLPERGVAALRRLLAERRQA